MLYEVITHGASFLGDAALAIVVTADPLASDVWIEDASIASLMIQLQAEDMGLGSCWIQIRERYTATRITSYNVCYTKLLRIGNIIFSVCDT